MEKKQHTSVIRVPCLLRKAQAAAAARTRATVELQECESPDLCEECRQAMHAGLVHDAVFVSVPEAARHFARSVTEFTRCLTRTAAELARRARPASGKDDICEDDVVRAMQTSVLATLPWHDMPFPRACLDVHAKRCRSDAQAALPGRPGAGKRRRTGRHVPTTPGAGDGAGAGQAAATSAALPAMPDGTGSGSGCGSAVVTVSESGSGSGIGSGSVSGRGSGSGCATEAAAGSLGCRARGGIHPALRATQAAVQPPGMVHRADPRCAVGPAAPHRALCDR